MIFLFYYTIGGLGDWGGGSTEHENSSPIIETETSIPQKIWYKLGPKGLGKESREWTSTCLDQNPSWTSEFMSDDSSNLFVKDHFASRVDIVDTYLSLSVPILKADLLRYLLLYAEGGIWSDLDVSCEPNTTIQDWIPPEYKANSSLVVGWEFDVGWPGNFVRQFATWTVMAKPRSAHMLMVIEDILATVHEKAQEHNVSIADLTLKMTGDVVDFTGPRRMTSSILKSLALTLESKVEIETIWKLKIPKLVGDVLVLPGYAFARSSNHYKEGHIPSGALVTHHFAGSWKNEYGGE